MRSMSLFADAAPYLTGPRQHWVEMQWNRRLTLSCRKYQRERKSQIFDWSHSVFARGGLFDLAVPGHPPVIQVNEWYTTQRVWTLTSSGRPRSRKRWNLLTSFRFFLIIFSRAFCTRSAAGLRWYLLSRNSIFGLFGFLLTAREACLNADGNIGITLLRRHGLRMLFSYIWLNCEYVIQYEDTNTWIKISGHFRGEPGDSNRFCSRSSSLVRLLANSQRSAGSIYDDLLEVSLFIINSLSCYPAVSCL